MWCPWLASSAVQCEHAGCPPTDSREAFVPRVVGVGEAHKNALKEDRPAISIFLFSSFPEYFGWSRIFSTCIQSCENVAFMPGGRFSGFLAFIKEASLPMMELKVFQPVRTSCILPWISIVSNKGAREKLFVHCKRCSSKLRKYVLWLKWFLNGSLSHSENSQKS